MGPMTAEELAIALVARFNVTEVPVAVWSITIEGVTAPWTYGVTLLIADAVIVKDSCHVAVAEDLLCWIESLVARTCGPAGGPKTV
jgi:hypothetical protein